MAHVRVADEVEKIAKPIITAHHPHLLGCEIRYHFRSKAQVKAGRTTLGTMRVVKGEAAMMALNLTESVDAQLFVMVIAEPEWEVMQPHIREALVDHELCHAGVETDSKGIRKYVSVGHDLEEFGSIIKRHGLWQEQHAKFIAAYGKDQLALFASQL
jgi:hypothetical protein